MNPLLLIIKQVLRPGKDSQIFRAYTDFVPTEKPNHFGRYLLEPLGVSVSTTGSEIFAVQKCAVKAFIKFAEPKADTDEIETRIKISRVGPAAGA